MTNLDKIATHPLQTSAWAEFRKKWGNEILETDYGILTLHKIPLMNYKIGIFEKGPAPTQPILDDLIKIGRDNHLVFIKLEPNVGWEFPISNFQFPTTKTPKLKSKLIKLLKQNGAVKGRRLFTPTTFWIDLTPTETDLMNSFSSKTRYNIRLSEKKGVKVQEDNSDKAF
jgi:lipid II:glycine glycyltransferase (peptidoglycan interpeptide bridge formation enzyme)